MAAKQRLSPQVNWHKCAIVTENWTLSRVTETQLMHFHHRASSSRFKTAATACKTNAEPRHPPKRVEPSDEGVKPAVTSARTGVNQLHQGPVGIGAFGWSVLCMSTMYVPSSSFLEICSITACGSPIPNHQPPAERSFGSEVRMAGNTQH